MARGRNQYNQVPYLGMASATLAGVLVGRIVKMAMDTSSVKDIGAEERNEDDEDYNLLADKEEGL